MMGGMARTTPEVDVRRAAAVVWRALVLSWVIGAVLLLGAGSGGFGLTVVSVAVSVAAVPVLLVGGTASMLVEHRLAGARSAVRAAVYAPIGAVVAFASAALVMQSGSASWLGLWIAAVGAVSASGASVWADWSRRRGLARRAVHPAVLGA